MMAAAAGPCEFSLESVRQYMLMRDGQVTNHELVKHFRAWLTHPTQKEASRQKFKEYVNTLATVRQENGEKYLVLKRKFYPKFDDEDESGGGNSLLDEVMAGYAPIAALPPASRPPDPPLPVTTTRRQLPPVPNDFRPTPPPSRSQQQQTPSLPPYRPPPPVPPPELPLPSDYGLPAPRQGMFHPPPEAPPLPPPRDQYSTRIALPHPSSVSSSISVSSSSRSRSSIYSQQHPILEEQQHCQFGSSSSDVEETESSSSKIDEKISVRERTKTFNRMASEVDVVVQHNNNNVDVVTTTTTATTDTNTTCPGVKRRNSRAVATATAESGNDSSSISTMDQTAKQWMVKAAQRDYHAMVKMLRDEGPRLAKHRDFVSGYTGLHWAAKHGDLDMVKLLAGCYSVNVNQKSHGGYTPLHLACQFGHQQVFDVLVKAYAADPHLRDNSGKKARQYLVVQDQAMGLSMSSDTFRQLKDRRRHRRSASNNANGGGMLRFGSLSVKVKKTTEAFNNYFNHKFESDGLGPISLPMELTGGSGSDKVIMPPPKFTPSSLKKRKSKRSTTDHLQSAPVTPTADRSPIKEESLEDLKRITKTDRSDSDSEYGFDSQWAATPRS